MVEKRKEEPERYLIGDRTDIGKTVNISEDNLKKHFLVVGKQESGKTSLLKGLVRAHIRNMLPFGLFDSNGALWDFALAELVILSKETKKAENVALLNTHDKKWVVGFKPFSERLLATFENSQRIRAVFEEAMQREDGIKYLRHREDPQQGTRFFYLDGRESSPPFNNYFLYSLEQRKKELDFNDIFRNKLCFMAKVPYEPGSILYSMLLFDDYLLFAEYSPRKDFHLVFIDEAIAFLGPSLPQTLKRLTENNIGLIVTTTYNQLASLKQFSHALYHCLIQSFGCLIALGSKESDLPDVMGDITTRLSL